jgi:hypothetical protein
MLQGKQLDIDVGALGNGYKFSYGSTYFRPLGGVLGMIGLDVKMQSSRFEFRPTLYVAKDLNDLANQVSDIYDSREYLRIKISDRDIGLTAFSLKHRLMDLNPRMSFVKDYQELSHFLQDSVHLARSLMQESRLAKKQDEELERRLEKMKR